MSTATKTAKPPVTDTKGNVLDLGVKVFYDEKSSGYVTGLEHQRQRVVIQPADEKAAKVVRPAGKVRAEKNKSGKIQVVQAAVRGARRAAKANA